MADTAGLEKDRVSWPAGIVVFEEAQLHGESEGRRESRQDNVHEKTRDEDASNKLWYWCTTHCVVTSVGISGNAYIIELK